MSRKIRVGAVSYLNAKPLYHRLADCAGGVELSMDLPSRLASRLASGDLDIALIPSVEYLRGASSGYEILPGFAIAARGAVRSGTVPGGTTGEDPADGPSGPIPGRRRE